MTDPAADVAALAARLTGLNASLAALPAAGPTEVRTISTGRSVAQEWSARDMDGRRAMLTSQAIWANVTRAEVRGRKGFDPARVSIAQDDGVEYVQIYPPA